MDRFPQVIHPFSAACVKKGTAAHWSSVKEPQVDVWNLATASERVIWASNFEQTDLCFWLGLFFFKFKTSVGIGNLGYSSAASLQSNLLNFDGRPTGWSKHCVLSLLLRCNMFEIHPFSGSWIALIFFSLTGRVESWKLQLDVSTILKSLSVFKRSICVEALVQLKISKRIWQKSWCQKMAHSCTVKCLLVPCFIFGSCFCIWYLQLFWSFYKE